MTSATEVYNPLSAYNSALNKLEKNGIRATKQRRVLAKLIFDKGKRHISAENLFDEVKKDERKISMATIYNTLKQFTSLGLIREIVVDQNKSLYCNNNQSHYHLYIEDEGKVIDIPTQNIDLDIPSIPACLKLHDIDVIVRIRTLKDKSCGLPTQLRIT
jgi:Fur family iron response transcriptional regulator